jgi:hypothetical protein
MTPPHLVMSGNSQPRQPVLRHSPMWLKVSSFSNRIMLFIRLSLIHGEHQTTKGTIYYVLLTVPLHSPQVTYGGTYDVQPSFLMHSYKNQITHFQNMDDRCSCQITSSDHNIFDLTSSHFDSYCLHANYT